MEIQPHLDRFYEHLAASVKLSREEFDAFSPHIIVTPIKKKEYLIEPGQIARTMNFISHGCMRAFYLDDDIQEHTLQLGIEGWWINDLYSYLKEVPSKMYVQALEDTVLVQLRKDDLEELYADYPWLSDFFRVKIQSAYVALQERTIESMSENAQERYARFLGTYRDLEQRVPQYIIASYLGIAPESLSRLRRRMANDR